jgi:hypothetical protein
MASLQVSASGNVDTLPKVPRCTGCDCHEAIKGDFQNCLACKNPLRCSLECQRKHWKLHKQECNGGTTKKSSCKNKENTSPNNEAPKANAEDDAEDNANDNANDNADDDANDNAKVNANDDANDNANDIANGDASKKKETATTSPKLKVNVAEETPRQVVDVLAHDFATTVVMHAKHASLGRTIEAIVGHQLRSKHILTSQKAHLDEHQKSLCSAATLRVDQEHLKRVAKRLLNTVAKTLLHADPKTFVSPRIDAKRLVRHALTF